MESENGIGFPDFLKKPFHESANSADGFLKPKKDVVHE